MIRITRIFLLAVVLLSGCGKASNQVPNVAVDVFIPLGDPRLSSIGQGFTISGGVAGIIVYRSSRGIVAFDRCSTVNPEKRCAVTLDGTFTATDPCSGAKYLLEDGSPQKAPATISLKEYGVTVTASTIRITN